MTKDCEKCFSEFLYNYNFQNPSNNCEEFFRHIETCERCRFQFKILCQAIGEYKNQLMELNDKQKELLLDTLMKKVLSQK